MTVEPLLGGKFVPGTWASYRVSLENNGPAAVGEIRVSSATQTSSTFAAAVELPTDARQEHIVYSPTGPFGSRVAVEFIAGGAVLARADLRTDAVPAGTTLAFAVAERPEGLIGPITNVLERADGDGPVVVTIRPEDLPPRAEGWAPIDILAWQDVESNRLDPPRLAALITWVSTGGHLVIFGGSTGIGSLGNFPAELLPYTPTTLTDVSLTDLGEMFGSEPPIAGPVPAIGGTLQRGSVLGRAGDSVIAARASYGLGSVAVVGIDPSSAWLIDWLPADGLWSRAITPLPDAAPPLPQDSGDVLAFALGNLPSVQLLPFEFVVAMIASYILVIGPVNYVVLRRRDRREWAWLTMFVTIVVFAIGAYGIGIALRGPSVVVNELAVVQGAAGSSFGMADVRVGVYSPNRATFDIDIGGDPLVSSPRIVAFGEEELPVDVLLGDPAKIRDYSVGFGTLRGFRAEAAVPAPRIDADLSIVANVVSGTLTNSSQLTLGDVTVVFGNAIQQLGSLAPGESRTVDLAQEERINVLPLDERLFGRDFPADPVELRRAASRRALVQYAAGHSLRFEASNTPRGPFARGPVILAWQSGAILQVDVGAPAEQVGETLFVLPARARVTGPALFSGSVMAQSVVDADAVEFEEQLDTYFLSRGTLTAEYRPLGVDGAFNVSALTVRLGTRHAIPSASSEQLAPLPVQEQPVSDAPLASDPRPGINPGAPRLQLFDRVDERWVEFEPLESSRSYSITDPARYVDSTGAMRARFVVRSHDFINFGFGVRLEGTVE